MEKQKFYYISGCIRSIDRQKAMDIMEEYEGKQVCIALVPYNPNSRNGWALARKDALMIVEALNASNSEKEF